MRFHSKEFRENSNEFLLIAMHQPPVCPNRYCMFGVSVCSRCALLTRYAQSDDVEVAKRRRRANKQLNGIFSGRDGRSVDGRTLSARPSPCPDDRCREPSLDKLSNLSGLAVLSVLYLRLLSSPVHFLSPHILRTHACSYAHTCATVRPGLVSSGLQTLV